jgi:demethylmenaquinone methyltransferase/2-methoxy-6-polyprenyl-1,4-benzoquinol methylase
MSVTPDDGQDSALEKSYKWMHRHFPHIVDCQPIPAAQFLKDAGLTIKHREYVDIWSMPVAILVGANS